jgi:large subunit ribosomal protein L3
MGGRMGGKRVTVTNLKVVKIDTQNSLLLVKGAVPGPRNGLLVVSGQ